jgi:hypothetical protein
MHEPAHPGRRPARTAQRWACVVSGEVEFGERAEIARSMIRELIPEPASRALPDDDPVLRPVRVGASLADDRCAWGVPGGSGRPRVV